MSYEIFDFLRNLVLSFAGVLGKAVGAWSDSDSIRVNKGMDEVTKSVEDTASHPHICFVVNDILSIGVDNLGRSVHGCGHALNIFFDGVVVFFADLGKVINLFSTWPEITQFVVFILTQQNIFYLHVSVIVPSRMNWLKSL